jgi:hypothetical protein
MDKIYDICCGIDVHKKLIVVCFKKGNKQEIREFGATTREILELADWLKDSGCQIAAMESTGSYWKPLYNILEPEFFRFFALNGSARVKPPEMSLVLAGSCHSFGRLP